MQWNGEFRNDIYGLNVAVGGLAVANTLLLGLDALYNGAKKKEQHIRSEGDKIPREYSTENLSQEYCLWMKKSANSENDGSKKLIQTDFVRSQLVVPIVPTWYDGYKTLLGNFSHKLNKVAAKWSCLTNSSLDWNEWSRSNPREARNACLEAEYFYGNGNVLPKDWTDIIEKKWDSKSRGDAQID